jgi:hypothetical protein
MNPCGSHQENLEEYERVLDEYLTKIVKARKKEIWVVKIKELCDNIEKYCEHFKIKLPKQLKAIVDSNNLCISADEYAEFKRKEVERKEREERKRNAEQLKKWRAFETDFIHTQTYQELRYNVDKERIETSMRVEIPRPLAEVFYNKLKNDELKVGDKLLRYVVQKATNKEVVVGCHRFKRSYLMKFGKELFG